MSKWTLLFLLLFASTLPSTAQNASLPPLPEAVASFGAAVNGDGLYVYGGHIGKTHQHSVSNLSHALFHLDLAAPEAGWRKVAAVDGLQGLPLVSHGSEVCVLGGLSARNEAEEPEDLLSTAQVRCFDTATAQWRDLPALPAPRSSHDAVVAEDRIYAIGGWQLRGAGNEPVWHDHMAVIDMAAEEPAWRQIEQPFRRRALAVAAAGGKIYAFGGLGENGTSRAVDIFDPTTEQWSEGPELPETTGRMKGFGVSAFGIDDQVWLSGADGAVHVLDRGSTAWRPAVGHLETPRFFHRLLPHRDRLLFVGGASSQGHLADVESIALADLGAVGPAQEHHSSSRSASPSVSPSAAANWPGFRGRGDGRAIDLDLPVEWSDETVDWRVRLPGYGQSSPIAWGHQVFVTSADGDEKEELILTALDLSSGEITWRRRFEASQKIEASDMVSRSAPTPVVDGTGLYVFWESGDLVALSLDGETRWQRSLTADYGPFQGNHGVGSSLRLTDEVVIVQVTHDGPSYFVAIDKATGDNLWKEDRPSKVSWTTPILLQNDRGPVLLASAGGRVEAVDAASGKALWQFEGIEKNHVPSAVADSDLLVIASSETGQSLGLRRNPSGAVDHAKPAWRADGVASGFASPLIVGSCVAFVNKAGVLTCVDRETGIPSWKHRLPGACWASPIAADDVAYFFTKDGATSVLRLGSAEGTVLAENTLEIDGTVYGVAAVQKAFIVRTEAEVLRISQRNGDPE